LELEVGAQLGCREFVVVRDFTRAAFSCLARRLATLFLSLVHPSFDQKNGFPRVLGTDTLTDQRKFIVESPLFLFPFDSL
jgi:hypothetical protein